MWELLAQGTLTDYAQPAGFIGVLVFIIRWFMVALDKRNEVIEKMADKGNEVIERNTKAFTQQTEELREVKRAIRGAGLKLNDRSGN
jgi:hypothetical protein